MNDRHQEFRTIPFNLIDVPEWLRRPLDPRRHVRLMESVADHGVIETVRVRPLPDGRYQLMDGFRRYLAERAQGASTLEVLLHEGADEVTALARAIFSEEHRGGRSTLERAWLIKELQDALKRAGRPHAQKDIHQRIWASKGTISELLDLAELFPRDRLEAAAAERGVSLHRVHGLKRSILRALRDEPIDARIERAVDAALEGSAPASLSPSIPSRGCARIWMRTPLSGLFPILPRGALGRFRRSSCMAALARTLQLSSRLKGHSLARGSSSHGRSGQHTTYSPPARSRASLP